jgi:hypothetical protein
MTALNYIYRNLHAGKAFSVRHRGRVVARLENFVAHNVRFKVNEAGRLRVIAERHKNVHAFVCAEHYEPTDRSALGLTRVSYNPFRGPTFVLNDEPIHEAQSVLFTNGQCYLLEP